MAEAKGGKFEMKHWFKGACFSIFFPKPEAILKRVSAFSSSDLELEIFTSTSIATLLSLCRQVLEDINLNKPFFRSLVPPAPGEVLPMTKVGKSVVKGWLKMGVGDTSLQSAGVKTPMSLLI